MSDIAINMSGGSSVKLLTAGKYCDKNIVITASGGGVTPVEIMPAASYTFTDGDGSGMWYMIDPETYPDIQPGRWAQVGHIYKIVIDGVAHNAVCDNHYDTSSFETNFGVYFGDPTHGIGIGWDPDMIHGIVWRYYDWNVTIGSKTVNIAVYDITPSA